MGRIYLGRNAGNRNLWGFVMRQFFEDDDGALSMSRLLMFGAWFVASVVLIVQALSFDLSGGALLGVYVGAFAGGYALGKFADAKERTDD